MSYQLAIFDMDGTILDTLDDLADSMNYALAAHRMPERTVEEVRSFVGNGIMKLVERAVPEGTGKDEILCVYQTFRGYYKDHCAIKTKPYDGIREVILKLRENQIRTAVVSNKADDAVKSLCVDYFDGLFDLAIGDREGQRRKPAPDSVNAVLEHFQMDRKDAVYIGDSEVDLETAKNADMDVLMVGWGFREEKYLIRLGAEKVVHTAEELLAGLLQKASK